MSTTDSNTGAAALESSGGRRGQYITVQQARLAIVVLLVLVLLGLGFLLLKRGPAEAEPPTVEGTRPALDLPDAPPSITTGDVELWDGTLVDPGTVLGWWPVKPVESGDIEDVLERGQEALVAERWVEPAGDNALQAFLSVLAVEPGNTDALRGVAAVAGRFRIKAIGHLADGDLDAAERDIAVLAVTDPDAAAALDIELRQNRTVDALMERGEELLVSDQLWSDDENNALSRFAAVLQVKPGHPDAIRGIEQTVLRMFELAAWARTQERYRDALVWLQRIESVNPPTPAIEDLIAGTRQERRLLFDQIATDTWAALHEGDIRRAEILVAVAERAWPRAEALDLLREELTQSQIYGRLRPGDVFTDEFVDDSGSGPKMVVIQSGHFLMGSDPDDPQHRPSEAPQFEVDIAHGFATQRIEVTVGQFRQFVQDTGYVTSAENAGYSTVYKQGTGRQVRGRGSDWRRDFAGDEAEDNLPVVHVSWRDARAYVDWLAEKTGEAYRLLSEQEFEYVIRAGTMTSYWWGEGSPDRQVENLTGQGDRSGTRRRWNRYFEDYEDGYWGPAPVRSFRPNPWRLYDLAGNVSEWVEDCWHDNYLRAPTNGVAWVNPGCEQRVLRGGSWGSNPAWARSAFRESAGYGVWNNQIGFRIARDL